MPVRRHRPLAACAAILALAAPAVAARPTRVPAQALPAVGTVTVHRGSDAAAPSYADAGHGRGIGGEAYGDVGYWQSDYGREDDAAIFAARYGCARPIWNAKSNRYMAPCN